MIRAAVCLCLLAVAGLVAVLAYVAWQLPDRLELAIGREAELMRAAALWAIEQEGARLDIRLASIERAAAREIRAVREVADDKLSLAVGLVDVHLAAMRQDANLHLAVLNQTIRVAAAETVTLIPPARRSLEAVAENAELLGDCEGNPNCFANRAIPAMRAIEQVGDSSQRIAVSVEATTREIAAVAPQATQDAAAALASTRTITGRLASPWKWIFSGLRKIIPFF